MFTDNTFRFLDELAANNNRAWFESNKRKYDLLVREPALSFVGKMVPIFEKIAPSFLADSRKTGGSLMRVYRDTRFSSDKTPYKTNIGIQFRHCLGKDIHAPGFYVHIASNECFLAVGCWHPSPDALRNIRNFIVDKPEEWVALFNDKKLTSQWQLSGESLIRPPRGYAADHTLINDIKRKDFIALSRLTMDATTGNGLVKLSGKRFSTAIPYMKFLCAALHVPY